MKFNADDNASETEKLRRQLDEALETLSLEDIRALVRQIEERIVPNNAPPGNQCLAIVG